MNGEEDDKTKKTADEYRVRADAELDAKLEELNRRLCADESAAHADNAVLRESAELSDGEDYGRHALNAMRETLRRSRMPKPSDGRSEYIHSGHRARLRELAYRDGRLLGFNDITLIELVLSYIIPQRDVNPAAHALLDKFGSVLDVLQAPTAELEKVPAITHAAAEVLPLLLTVVTWRGGSDLIFDGPSDVAEVFGAMFCDGAPNGTYVLLLDKDYRMITIERVANGEAVPSRAVFGAVFKYSAKYVFLLRRENSLYPEIFGLNGNVSDLAAALDKVGVRLIDFFIFTDGGYYTVGAPPGAGDWYVKYMFVPLRRFMRAQTIADMHERGGLPSDFDYVGRDTAVSRDGLKRELLEFVSDKSKDRV